MMISQNEVMLKLKAYRTRVAKSHYTVLITGETGTEKDLAANIIHQYSQRARGPFVSMNCAALPENLVENELYGYKRGSFTGAINNKKEKFELASGGSLFLDEIGDMSLFSQAKILQSIETKEVFPLGAHN
jgi:transcriptional regulator with PAS, ATPase and Fis domain